MKRAATARHVILSTCTYAGRTPTWLSVGFIALLICERASSRGPTRAMDGDEFTRCGARRETLSAVVLSPQRRVLEKSRVDFLVPRGNVGALFLVDFT